MKLMEELLIVHRLFPSTVVFRERCGV